MKRIVSVIVVFFMTISIITSCSRKTSGGNNQLLNGENLEELRDNY